MQKVNILCIGKIKEKYFAQAIDEYAKRLQAFCKLRIIELAEEKIRGNNPNPAQIAEVLQAEGKRIMQKISPSDYVIALCIEGKLRTSEELAGTLNTLAVSGDGQEHRRFCHRRQLRSERRGQGGGGRKALHEPHDLSAHDGADDPRRTDLPRV